MKKRILIEVFIPILSLRFLVEVSLSLKIEEMKEMIYRNVEYITQKDIPIKMFMYVYNERSKQIMHPEQYLYESDIAYGDCLLLI